MSIHLIRALAAVDQFGSGGYALVPREPTMGMIKAAQKLVAIDPQSIAGIYSSMLEAGEMKL